MTNSGPLVTVIAMCFNHSRFAVQCLDSIRNQTYKNIQLIIMDDCSRDDSVAVIRDWIVSYDVDCVFVQHYRNVGICKTLNEALSHAKGKYVSMISTDDVWILDKIERQVAQMEKLPGDVGVLYSDAYQIDEDGNLLPGMFIEAYRQLPVKPVGNIFHTLVDGNFIPAMTTLVRKSAYDRVGLYDERLAYEDWDMWLRLSKYYKFVFSSYVSAKYRIVSTSLMRTLFTNENSSQFITSILIRVKLLASGSLEKQQKEKHRHRVAQSAEELYRLGDNEAPAYLWIAFRHKPNLKMFVLLILSVCRIPYGMAKRCDRFIRRWESYVLWKYSSYGSRSKQ